MELKDRIALARKNAGLTQEQLGEQVGVTRQAVSKWESGQTVPDAITAARLCQVLQVSADFLLLGREPETANGEPAYTPPDTCPCCGKEVSGVICPACGYPLPEHPPRGGQYALVATRMQLSKERERAAELMKYCGLTAGQAQELMDRVKEEYGVPVLLRRGLSDSAARWIAANLPEGYFTLKIVADLGEEPEQLVDKDRAMEPPPSHRPDSGIGFWGVVAAVVVALLILSIF